MLVVKKPKSQRQRRQRQVSARFTDQQGFADLLGLHVETIKRREKEGSIEGWPTPIRIGGKIKLYERSDIERFLQESKGKLPDKPQEKETE
jgi:hypothetical protein